MQSHSRLPSPSGTSSARWPIANPGSTPIAANSPSVRSSVRRPSRELVRRRPALAGTGTYWRSSSQIGQRSGGASDGVNCAAHVLQK